MAYCATLWSISHFTVIFAITTLEVILCDVYFQTSEMLRHGLVCVMLFVKYLAVMVHLHNEHYIIYL